VAGNLAIKVDIGLFNHGYVAEFRHTASFRLILSTTVILGKYAVTQKKKPAAGGCSGSEKW
jgi:hypothetical protein